MFCLRRARTVTHLVLDVRDLGGPEECGPLLTIVHQNLPRLEAYHVMVNAVSGVSLDMVSFGVVGIAYYEFTFCGAFVHGDSWRDTLDSIALLPSLAIHLPDVAFESFQSVSLLPRYMLGVHSPKHGAVRKPYPVSILHPCDDRHPHLRHTPGYIPGWVVRGLLVPQCTMPTVVTPQLPRG